MTSEDTQHVPFIGTAVKFLKEYKHMVDYAYREHGFGAAVFAVIFGPLFVLVAWELTEVPEDSKHVE